MVVLIGPPGAGKSTLCALWGASQRVSLDRFREMCTDELLDQSATVAALAAHLPGEVPYAAHDAR